MSKRFDRSTVALALACCAVFGAVLWSLYRPGFHEVQLVHGEQRLARLHQAIVAYGVDHEVHDVFPHWGPICPELVRDPEGARPYGDADFSELLWSPVLTYEERSQFFPSRYTSHSLAVPDPTHPGVIFPQYRNALEEAVALEDRFSYIVDWVFDRKVFFPRERDRSMGAVLIELRVNGSVETVRRPTVRFGLGDMQP